MEQSALGKFIHFVGNKLAWKEMVTSHIGKIQNSFQFSIELNLKCRLNYIVIYSSIADPAIFSAEPRDFLGMLLVTYLATAEAPQWWALRGEKNFEIVPF